MAHGSRKRSSACQPSDRCRPAAARKPPSIIRTNDAPRLHAAGYSPGVEPATGRREGRDGERGPHLQQTDPERPGAGAAHRGGVGDEREGGFERGVERQVGEPATDRHGARRRAGERQQLAQRRDRVDERQGREPSRDRGEGAERHRRQDERDARDPEHPSPDGPRPPPRAERAEDGAGRAARAASTRRSLGRPPRARGQGPAVSRRR